MKIRIDVKTKREPSFDFPMNNDICNLTEIQSYAERVTKVSCELLTFVISHELDCIILTFREIKNV